MDRTEFFGIVEEVTGADPNSINEDTAFQEFDGWDSLAIVQFIAIIDERLGVALPVKQITSCVTFGDLMKLFGEKII